MKQLDQKIMDNDKINREYGLIVKVDQRMVNVQDTNAQGGIIQYQSRMTYLVPLVNTATTFFFDAWLPPYAYNDKQEIVHHEVIVKFPYPIHRAVRCGVCRKNRNYPDAHHLVLMSSETFEEMLSKFIGKTFQVMVLPDNKGEDLLGY